MIKAKIFLLTAFLFCMFSVTSCNLLNQDDDEDSTTCYTVCFYSTGGSSVDSQRIESGKTAVMPTAPTKYNCVFGGWYTDYECNDKFNFSTPITHNTYLYAKWIANCTVTFDSAEGSSVDSQIIESGKCAVKPVDPTKDGYTFVSWYSDRDLTTLFDFNTVITSDITLYAKWISVSANTYTITFDTNGGKSIETQVVESGNTVTMPVSPTKEGYTFVSWCSDRDLTTLFDFNTVITSDITLYAKWISVSANTYTVTFDTNGGKSIETQVVESGNTVTMPDSPTKAGYTFVSWCSDRDLTTLFDFNTVITSDITLYAKWNMSVPTDLSVTAYDGYKVVFTSSESYSLDSSNSLRISWTDTGSSDCEIYYNTENDSNTASLITVKSSTSYRENNEYVVYIPDLEFYLRIYFWVKAKDGDDESSLSDSVSYEVETFSATTINKLLTTKLGAKGACTALKPSTTIPASNIKSYCINKDGATLWAEGSTIYYYTGSTSTIKLPNNCSGLFKDCTSIKEMDLTRFDTSDVTDMSEMFYYCEALETLDLRSFDTSNVTNMSKMFSWCKSLKSLDLRNFDTGKVTDMSTMFYYCEALETFDLKNFDTSHVIDMSDMFHHCESIKTLDLSSFDTGSVTTMESMFEWCEALEILDLRNFDTSKVTNMSEMFYFDNELTTIYVAENTDWASYIVDGTDMFSSCRKLVGENGTTYDGNNVNVTYAHVDTAEKPGYFTVKQN